MKLRLTVALLIGLAAGALCYGWLRTANVGDLTPLPDGFNDFTWPYRGAEQLRAGNNPYRANLEPLPYDHYAPLYYPLPAVLVTLPFTYLPGQLAAALFFGLSSALLAFAATRESWSGLLIFASSPYWLSLLLAQWTPLLTAVALWPAVLYPLAVLKPNLGAPIGAAHFTWRRASVAGAIVLLSLAALPTWPLDWLRNLGAGLNQSPVLVLPGFLLLLAALRWRDPGARLLLGLALLPQRLMGYDELILWAIPRTLRERVALLIANWLGVVAWVNLFQGQLMDLPHPLIICCLYLPALGCVLWPLAARRLGLGGAPAAEGGPPDSRMIEL